jgi:oligosaccharide repeat unit polymerase
LFQQSRLLGFAAVILFIIVALLVTFGTGLYAIQNNSIILSLLPLSFIATYCLFKPFKSDDQVITPKNIALFIWLNKLVIIPIELMTIGNKALIFDIKNQPINIETSIVLCSFIGFVIGWLMSQLKHDIKPIKGTRINASIYLSISYVFIGTISIIAIYGSFQQYFAGAWLTYVTKEAIEKATGNSIGYLANVGQRFLPFGVILAWIWWQQRFKKSVIVNVLFLIVCFLSTLSSNRSNMIYPLLTLASVLFLDWQIRNKIWLLAGIFSLVFLTFFFGFVRVQTDINSEQVGLLFNSYTSDNDYVWYAHQIYFGSPYQITPILYSPPSNHSMLLASILDPVPVVGKYFREHSGSFIYNLTIYDSTVSQDKTIPVAGELFYEGGYLLVAVVHILIGWLYAKLDHRFKQTISQNLPIALSIFYLTLLFNATLLLSVSVLVQFLIYNAAPALCILLYERSTRLFGNNISKKY